MIRLLLVDDHPVVRSGYRRYLEAAGDIEIVAEAADGAEAYRAFIIHRPDVTVLDITLEGISGLDVLRRIRQRDANARVIIFTMHGNPLLVERALEAGACGYLTKRCGPGLVVEAVRQVMGGKIFVDPALGPRRQGIPPLLERLTPREFEVFRLLAQGRSVAEIARLLHVSLKTAGVHQTRILRKLNLANTVQLVLLAVNSHLDNL